jgi:uncharacterized protein (TIGR03067 family)
MRLLSLATSIFASAVIVSFSQAKDEKGNLAKIQGTWEIVSLENRGKAPPPEYIKGLRLIFTADTISVSRDGKIEGKEVKYKLDPSKNPKTIDYIVDGRRIRVGLYSLRGDELKLCLSRNALNRPTEFKSSASDKHDLLVLKRVKK